MRILGNYKNLRKVLMQIVDVGSKEFIEQVKRKQIYCFGSGNYGRACINVLMQYGLTDHVQAFIDNNAKRWDDYLEVGIKKYPIISLDKVLEKEIDQMVILISCADVAGIYNQLERIAQLQNVPLYIWQLILSRDFKETETFYGKIRISSKSQIPKKIHYCWFGGSSIPKHLQKCIDSWKEHCPDYEIIRWDESNYDVGKNNYMRQAYEREKWGFVPDYARLDIIYHHGGIYLDTDVELLKNIDDLLYQEAFCGIHIRKYVDLGLGFGAIPHHPLIKEFRDYYDTVDFINKNNEMNLAACDLHQYEVLKKYGFKFNNQYQIIKGMSIYPTTVLDGKDSYRNALNVKDCTFSIHHGSLSWFSSQMKKDRENRNKFFENLL